MELTKSTTTTSTNESTITSITSTRNTRNNNNNNKITTPNTTMNDSNNGSDSRKKPQLFHSVSIIVEPVYDDDDSCSIPLVLTPNEVVVTSTAGSESTIIPSSVSPTSPILDYDDFIFESQRKKSQEEDEIVQALMANAQLRKEEFARLLEEHAQLVNEINRAETTLL